MKLQKCTVLPTSMYDPLKNVIHYQEFTSQRPASVHSDNGRHLIVIAKPYQKRNAYFQRKHASLLSSSSTPTYFFSLSPTYHPLYSPSVLYS
jgi:hypothetical protein